MMREKNTLINPCVCESVNASFPFCSHLQAFLIYRLSLDLLDLPTRLYCVL